MAIERKRKGRKGGGNELREEDDGIKENDAGHVEVSKMDMEGGDGIKVILMITGGQQSQNLCRG